MIHETWGRFLANCGEVMDNEFFLWVLGFAMVLAFIIGRLSK